MTEKPDWIVKHAAISSAPGVSGHIRAEIENLCHAADHVDRHTTWILPLSSLANPRYDWTNAKYESETVELLVLRARVSGK